MTTSLREAPRPARTPRPAADVEPDPSGITVVPDPETAATSRMDAVLVSVLALVLWGVVVFLGRTWGLLLDAQQRKIVLYTPPLLGGYRTDVDVRFLLPITVAVALVVLLPWAAARLAWRPLLWWSSVAASAWWVALALIDGLDGLTHGLEWDTEYRDTIPSVVAAPGTFVRGFVDHLPTSTIQVRGHPPGLPLLLAGLDRSGLRGPGWAAALVLVAAASGIVAVLVTVRAVAGEGTARRALPFVVLAPAAIWIATSFDALYFGVAAWSVTALVLAMRATGARRVGLAAAAGALGAVALLFSYGLVLVAAIVVFVAWRERQWGPVLIAAATAAVGIAAFVPLGFWYGAGLAGTRHEYDTLDLDRPYSYFVVNNVAALALVIGPALAVALVRLRDRRLWLLVGGALLAVALADASGLSNGEVERIWLPFAVWILPAGAVLATSHRATRAWLAVQAASAIVLSALINTYW